MKKVSKILAIFLAALVLFTAIPVSVSAEAVAENDLYSYTVDTETNTATITGLLVDSTAFLGIPDVIDGYTVTAIGSGAFQQCSSAESIYIPETVTSIGSSAFKNSQNLKTVYIPSGVTAIEAYTFYNCQNLEKLEFPNGCNIKEIGSSAFRNCKFFTDDTVLSKVEKLSEYAFRQTGFYEVTIPKTLTDFGTMAFYKCENLTRIVTEDGLKSLGGIKTFSYCPALTYVELADSVRGIGSYAFENSMIEGQTEGDVRITLSNGMINIGNGVFYNCSALNSVICPISLKAVGYNAFEGSGIEKIHFPITLTTIYESAFQNCTSLSEVVFSGDSVEIRGRAFANCTSLKHIAIPSGSKVNKTAFTGCNNIEIEANTNTGTWIPDSAHVSSVIIPEGTVKIPNGAFKNLTNLKNVQFPSTLETIGEEAFYGCTSLEAVIIPEGAKVIQNKAFYGCTSLKEISLPNSLIEIGDMSFSGCTSIESIVIPEGTQAIKIESFYGCTALKEVTLPETLAMIGDGAFMDCAALTSINIGETVSYIGEFAFKNCTSLTSIYLPDSLTTLGEKSFENTAITEVVLPKSINYESGAEYAFYNCTSLTKVTLPEGMTCIPDGIFSGCTSLIEINIPEDVDTIGSFAFSGCAFEEITIPDGLMVLSSGVFSNCKNLREITIPVYYVGGLNNKLFNGCTSLEKVNLPNTITSFGEYCFAGCESLKYINIPITVSKISKYAFSGCSSLEKIALPIRVSELSEGTFYSCTSLKEITLAKKTKSIGTYAFKNCTSLESIDIPITCIIIGEESFMGCTSLKSVNCDGVEDIYYGAFKDCTSLEDLPTLYYLETIGAYAFYNCSNLEEFTMIEGVSCIGEYAFAGSGLLEIYVPSSATYLYKYLFDGCTKLETITIGEGMTMLLAGPFSGNGGKEIILPKSLMAIDGKAFFNNKALEKIELQEGLVAIGQEAFAGTGLKSVTIPSSVGYIYHSAFKDCTELKEVNIMEGVVGLGTSAFENSGLVSVNIPSSITGIGTSCFRNCTDLESIETSTDGNFNLGINAVFNTAFYNDPENWENGMLYLGEHLIDVDEKLEGAVSVKDGTKYICSYSFESCDSITKVKFPEGVERIENDAFSGCDKLRLVYLPSTLTYMAPSSVAHTSYVVTFYYAGTEEEFKEKITNYNQFNSAPGILESIIYGYGVAWDDESNDLSELFANYKENSIYEMVEFIDANQETISWVELFRNNSKNDYKIHLHIERDPNTQPPHLIDVGITDIYGKYVMITDSVINPEPDYMPGNVMIGNTGNSIISVELNAEFIEHINSLNRLDGNVMILDLLMNILDSEEIVGISWNGNNHALGDTGVSLFSISTENGAYEPAVMGDCNGDGIVNGIDGNMMRRILSGIYCKVDPFAIDLNSDGLLNAKDCLELKKIVLNG